MASRLTAVLAMLVYAAAGASAQDAGQRAYLPNPANENWSFLKDPALRTDFWDGLKYISLGRDDRFVTLSGELRYRPEGFRIRGSDGNPSTRDNYFLQRYLFGVDVHMSEAWRIFGEVQSGIITGRLAGPRPTDHDSVDLHQAFVDWRPKRTQPLGIRLGRQELTVGSSRLISASPGLNVKRSFDGARFTYAARGWSFEGAAALLTALKSRAWDDNPSADVKFWGFAAQRPSPRVVRGDLGLYYLGLENRKASYAQGVGRDLRHTFGLKWRGSNGRFDLNYDMLFQAGNFEGARARAWAVSTETGYRFVAAPGRPRIGVRVNKTSGDRDASDPRLESFNPLFPGASYAGALGLLGPTNLTDVTPTLLLLPHPRVTVGVESPFYWRTSAGDGLYNMSLQLLFPPSAGHGRFVGTNPGVLGTWQVTRHLQLQGAVLRFVPGTFLETTNVRHGVGFYSMTFLYRF